MLAQAIGASLPQVLIWVIVVVALVMIVVVACRAMGMNIPDWAWKIAGIIVIAVVAVLAIKVLLSVI